MCARKRKSPGDELNSPGNLKDSERAEERGSGISLSAHCAFT